MLNERHLMDMDIFAKISTDIHMQWTQRHSMGERILMEQLGSPSDSEDSELEDNELEDSDSEEESGLRGSAILVYAPNLYFLI